MQCVSPSNDFDARLQEWKRADTHLAEARERLSHALLAGAEPEHAEELHREVLKRRGTADALLSSLLQDLKRRSGSASA